MVKNHLNILFLYWEECPSHPRAWDRLHAVLAKMGMKARVQRVQIQTEAEARRWNFPGSPTIRIEGRDLDPEGAARQAVGLSCRLYHLPDGRVRPLPTEEMIRAAIERSFQKETSGKEGGR